jgi:hypothetical protein
LSPSPPQAQLNLHSSSSSVNYSIASPAAGLDIAPTANPPSLSLMVPVFATQIPPFSTQSASPAEYLTAPTALLLISAQNAKITSCWIPTNVFLALLLPRIKPPN